MKSIVRALWKDTSSFLSFCVTVIFFAISQVYPFAAPLAYMVGALFFFLTWACINEYNRKEAAKW